MTDAPTPKRTPSLGQLIDRLSRLRTARHVDSDAAVRKVHERYAAKEAKLMAEIEPGMRAKIEMMLDDGSNDVIGPLPEPPRSDPRSCFDVARDATVDHSDDTPSRPELPEYDARGVMEPLPPERAAVAKGKR